MSPPLGCGEGAAGQQGCCGGASRAGVGSPGATGGHGFKEVEESRRVQVPATGSRWDAGRSLTGRKRSSHRTEGV